MARPTANAPSPTDRRWRPLVLVSLLPALGILAGQSQGWSNLHLPVEMSFETTNLAKLKLQVHASSRPQERISPVEEADRSFTNNYDAEKIANYYGAKYKRSTDYLLTIIHHAAVAANENNVSPFILLAIISHESNFLHTARNSSGAEGLMQIMTTVHKKRFERYGGTQMTYLPEVNIRVGATILRECIGIMKSVSGGLRCYAGTINDDGGFLDFVLREAAMIKKIASRSQTKAVR